MAHAFPQIPYGWADFEAMRLERCLYVDKTRFLHELENERYAVLIRPRRFGKSCWVSLLENYYDRNRADRFESLFAGTDIGAAADGEPPSLRNPPLRLLGVRRHAGDPAGTFETYCHTMFRAALERNPDLFPDHARRRILSPPAIDGKLNELFAFATDHDIRLYVLIDEYDNFANTILAYHGEEAYQSITHGGGFYRNFFATLKAGAGYGRGIERLFITGVSPITMDDVTSGFNIGTNISLHRKFDELMGFTAGEVRDVLESYRDRGVFDQDVDETMAVMGEWYHGYRFARGAPNDVYNTDMVLYYLKASIPNDEPPDNLIDRNVRINYGKLRHLLTVNRQLNGNFDLLATSSARGGWTLSFRTAFPWSGCRSERTSCPCCTTLAC